MALITSAQSGNFNNPATWTGGVVPTVGDEARIVNGHAVTITVDTTCDEVIISNICFFSDSNIDALVRIGILSLLVLPYNITG